MENLLNSTQGAINGESDFLSRSGSKIVLGYSASPFKDSRGNLAGYIVNLRDLTHLRQMEAALKRSDRLAALGELSARMAHEIRNPLAALCGSVQLLASHWVVEESDRRLLTIVLREANRLDSLITEFLEYACPKQPNTQIIHLYDLLEDTRLLLERDQRFNSIEISNLVPSHTLVAADPDQLRQVLINLLKNAADAQPEGGYITIETRLPESNPAIIREEIMTTITITDGGGGITEEAARHLFEPFWTTKCMVPVLALLSATGSSKGMGGN